MKSSGFVKELNKHLELMDRCDPGVSTMFMGARSKERYETLLTFAARRIVAARYHQANVIRFKEEEAKAIARKRRTFRAVGGKAASSRISVVVSQERYVYELTAFLTALKSALDLIAEATSVCLRGVKTNHSIKPLMSMAEKGRRGIVLTQVAENIGWLTSLRDYRHPLIHRLVPAFQGGYELRAVGGKITATRYPVTVPVKTPRYVPDTRRHRMLEAEMIVPQGIGVWHATGSVKFGSSLFRMDSRGERIG